MLELFFIFQTCHGDCFNSKVKFKCSFVQPSDLLSLTCIDVVILVFYFYILNLYNNKKYVVLFHYFVVLFANNLIFWSVWFVVFKRSFLIFIINTDKLFLCSYKIAGLGGGLILMLLATAAIVKWIYWFWRLAFL